MKLSHIFLLFILATISSSCIDQSDIITDREIAAMSGTLIPGNGRTSLVDSTYKKVLTVMLGQSNAVYYFPNVMGNEYVKGVHGWDQKNKVWVDSLSWFQCQTNTLTTYKWSPLIGVAAKMKVNRPNQDLYFLMVAQAGTNLYRDWKATRNYEFSRFRQAVNAINDAIAQAGPFDEINFIWVQGESDQNPDYSAVYYENQTKLFDSLDVLYNVNKFLDYKIYGASPNVVNQAKYDVAALRNDTEVIAIPVVVTGPTATRTYPDVGQVHMTKYGVRVFVDSLAAHLN